MALLGTAAQRQLTHEFSRETFTAATRPAEITKDDLIAAIAGIDAYLEANAAAMNAAIPLPARSFLTVPEKARLLSLVALARWGG